MIKKEDKQNGAAAEPKQHSMLELLELQARARAIRSQLALEPVTKIELDDSDIEETVPEPPKQPVPSTSKSTKSDKITANRPNEPVKSTTVTVPTAAPAAAPEAPAAPNGPRPVRLKRNFRQRQMNDGNESDEGRKVTETPVEEKTESCQVDTPASVEPEKSENEQKPDENVAGESNVEAQSSQPDDDIIPIVAEPEILCISSSESDSEDNKEKKEKKSTKRSYITMPVVVPEVREPTEDEIFLQRIREKSAETLRRKRNEEAAANAAESVASTDVSGTKVTEKDKSDAEDGEKATDVIQLEDGEIADDDEVVDICESSDESEAVDGKNKNDQNDKANETKLVVSSENVVPDDEKSSDSGSDSSSSSSSDNESNDEAKDGDNKLPTETEKIEIDDDDDEDIIDLGDDDLDFEMKTASPEPEVEKVEEKQRKKKKSRKSSKGDSTADDEPKVNIFFFHSKH